MEHVTRALNALSRGDASGEYTLPESICGEPRAMAAGKGKMAHERPDHTFQATALSATTSPGRTDCQGFAFSRPTL